MPSCASRSCRVASSASEAMRQGLALVHFLS